MNLTKGILGIPSGCFFCVLCETLAPSAFKN